MDIVRLIGLLLLLLLLVSVVLLLLLQIRFFFVVVVVAGGVGDAIFACRCCRCCKLFCFVSGKNNMKIIITACQKEFQQQQEIRNSSCNRKQQ